MSRPRTNKQLRALVCRLWQRRYGEPFPWDGRFAFWCLNLQDDLAALLHRLLSR